MSKNEGEYTSPFKLTADWLRTTCETLLRPFIDTGDPKTSEVKILAQKGTHSYIEANTCIDRLNEAFTPLGWGTDTSRIEWQPGNPDPDENGRITMNSRQVAVYCRLYVYTPWGTIEKGGWGARTVMATAAGTKMDFGDDLKSAASDGLKKAATQLGIFNYIYRKSALPLDPLTKPIAEKLNELRTAKGWTKDQFLTFCSGVTRKTILGAGDLTPVQAEACYAILKDMVAELQPAA